MEGVFSSSLPCRDFFFLVFGFRGLRLRDEIVVLVTLTLRRQTCFPTVFFCFFFRSGVGLLA